MPLSPLLAETSWVVPLMFAAGCALLASILLRRSYRYFGGRRKRAAEGPIDTQPRPANGWSGAKQDAEARFNRQKVELHELSRELNGQIDSKLILLRELIAQSERQAERLEGLLRDAEEMRG